MITVEQVRNNPQVRTYIQKADEALAALGYTEHSFAHVGKVAKEAREILLTLGYSPREAELAEIAGWLHDIGNVINRVDHAQSGAVMAFRILDKLGAEITAYYATEIDKYAVQTTQHNYPDTVQLGDAFQVRAEDWHLPEPAGMEAAANG